MAWQSALSAQGSAQPSLMDPPHAEEVALLSFPPVARSASCGLQENALQPALEEQRRILRQHGDHIDVDVLNEMDVLHSNMTEVLRLFPPLILLMRMVKKSFSVTDSKGRQTVIPKVSWACHCGPSVCERLQGRLPAQATRVSSSACACRGSLHLAVAARVHRGVTGFLADVHPASPVKGVHTDADDGPDQL